VEIGVDAGQVLEGRGAQPLLRGLAVHIGHIHQLVLVLLSAGNAAGHKHAVAQPPALDQLLADKHIPLGGQVLFFGRAQDSDVALAQHEHAGDFRLVAIGGG